MQQKTKKIDVGKLGTNYSERDSIKLRIKKKKVRRKSKSKRGSAYRSVYESILEDRDRDVFMEAMGNVDPVAELALTRTMIVKAFNSGNRDMLKSVPGLIKTASDLFDRIRRSAEGMKVVVSFKDEKFSSEVMDNLADRIADMLKGVSDTLCNECRETLRSNLDRYVDSATL